MSTNASPSVPAETTSPAGTIKDTEIKDEDYEDPSDIIIIEPIEILPKETENLKRPAVEVVVLEDEEVKPKKRKEDHIQSSKGDLF